MFNSLYSFFTNNLDKPSILFRLNLWSYVNIRFFKQKISIILIFLLASLQFLKQKTIKVWHKNFFFENFYGFFFKTILILFIFLLF